MKALLDTDIVSYYMKGNEIVKEHIKQYLLKYPCLNISRITIVEILGGLQARQAKTQETLFRDFIRQHCVLEITEVSGEISANIFADLYKKGKHSGNYDILIAGIAVANDLTLISNNTKDYENIKDLKLDNWTK